MSTFVSTGDGCRMATTGSRGVTAVTSRRHSWHSPSSCYRASLPRRDERTGPQPLAARPLHVKAEGEPLQCPPTLRRHWSSNTTRLRARQPHQPKTPRVGTDAAPDVFACPCLLPVTTKPGHHPPKQRQEMVPLRSGPEDSRNSRDRGWDRAISSIRLSTHKSPPGMLRRHRSPPSGNYEGLAVNDICASRDRIY